MIAHQGLWSSSSIMAQIQAKKFRTEAAECQLNAEKAEKPTDQRHGCGLDEASGNRSTHSNAAPLIRPTTSAQGHFRSMGRCEIRTLSVRASPARVPQT